MHMVFNTVYQNRNRFIIFYNTPHIGKQFLFFLIANNTRTIADVEDNVYIQF